MVDDQIARAWAEEKGFGFMTTSTKSGIGINNAFGNLITLMSEEPNYFENLKAAYT